MGNSTPIWAKIAGAPCPGDLVDGEAPVEEPEEPVEEPGDGFPGTDATIEEILAWVGEDDDRRIEALDAELARDEEDQRSTLIAQLTTSEDNDLLP